MITNIIVKLIAILLLCFVVGYYVGKDIAESKNRRSSTIKKEY